MFVTSRDLLDTSCRDDASADPQRAVRLVSDMGPLGRLWLQPEVLALAERFAGGASLPRAPVGSGGFHALLLTPGRGRYAALRPAFALPLRWVAGDAHSPHLPPGLADFATTLLAEHETEFGIAPPPAGRWTLQLGGGLEERCDFSRFDFGCEWESAAAAIIGGLQLAAIGAPPDEHVMASVAWAAGGLGRVEGIADKLDAARDAGARLAFLAAADNEAAARWRVANPETPLRTILLEPRPTLRESLAPFLQAIEARPGADAPLPELQRFYEKRLLGAEFTEQRRSFYLDVIVDRLATDYQGPLPPADPCRNLIGVVGPGTAPPMAFLARVLTPRRVLLLHDVQAASHAAALEAHLSGVRGIAVKLHEFKTLFGPLDELRPEVERAIVAFLGDDPIDDGVVDTVIDLTGGARRLPFVLLDVAPARAACVHIDAERVNGQIERIGTEKIVTIDVQRTGRLATRLLSALSQCSVSVPVWHLAPIDRWHLLRDTCLGHAPVRGGMRTRDLPLDPVARRMVETAARIQSSEYEVGGKVKCRFGDWLYLFAVLVEPALAKSPDAAHAAIRECVLEMRQALGFGERKDFANKCPFHHRLLGALGLSRQEWQRLAAEGTSFGRERQVARLGARVCAAFRSPGADRLKPEDPDVFSWAIRAIGAKDHDRELLQDLADAKRVLVTIKPMDIQRYMHRAKMHWMMRGASVWCAQSLAFARDRILEIHGGLLLSDLDALVALVFPENAPAVEDMLRDVAAAWASPECFKAHFPRLAAYHPANPQYRNGIDPVQSLPLLSAWRFPTTSLLDLCVARGSREPEMKDCVSRPPASEASTAHGVVACSFVEHENAYVSHSPTWLTDRGDRQPENYGWSAICWSLSGTTLRTHWHHGVCAALNRDDYPMMAVSHGGWLEHLKMKTERLTFVKLDGDGVGDRFLDESFPSRPLLGLKLGRLVQERVLAATRRVLEVHDAAKRPKYLPVDLVYFGGDDLFFCLPGCYLEPFLQGFGQSFDGSDLAPWKSTHFSAISVKLPPGSDFTDNDRLAKSEEFARANLAAARMLGPGLRDLVKDGRCDDETLAELNDSIAALGYRCEWAGAPTGTGVAHGVSLSLVRLPAEPAISS
jgi:hypothetical protein